MNSIKGAYRLHQIREYHADIREWDHEKAVVKAAEAAKQKKWLAKEEMRYLMKVRLYSIQMLVHRVKVVNIPFEEGVAQFGVEDLYRDE